MPTVRKVAAVAQALAAEAARNPKAQELLKVQAEIETLENKDELTDAESERLEKLRERAEALEMEIDREEESDDNDNPSLADLEARLRKEPRAMAVLTKEGLTPREYVLCTFALFQAALVEGLSKGKADLSNLPDGVNPENVRFVRENKAELEKLQKLMAGKKE